MHGEAGKGAVIRKYDVNKYVKGFDAIDWSDKQTKEPGINILRLSYPRTYGICTKCARQKDWSESMSETVRDAPYCKSCTWLSYGSDDHWFPKNRKGPSNEQDTLQI